MTAYYNEFDPGAAAHLQDLMDAGLIARGDIDTRSIEDVTPNDVRGYTQCHWFAGIGGWGAALRLAGWPDDRRVWTGSCPCQPFSAAGKGDGFSDERHLWPAWQHLIAQCQPSIIFGEQVASKAVNAWIDLVHADLEGMGYAFGCIPFPAAGIGAAHIRDRTYWVADLCGQGLAQRISNGRVQRETVGACSREAAIGVGAAERLANAECERRARLLGQSGIGVVGGHDSERSQPGLGLSFEIERLANAGSKGSEEQRRQWHEPSRFTAPSVPVRLADDQRSGPLDGFWRDADWLRCTDGKWRPVEPGTQPLAYGLPAGMGKLPPELQRLAALAGLDGASLKRAKAHRIASLKGYGNAIVPEQAAEFIRCVM